MDVVLRREEREQKRGCANIAAGFLELHRWLCGQGIEPQQTRVVLEATGSYSDAIALFLYEHDDVVSVLNEAVLVDYRHSVNVRSKTDALDARLLARYAQERRPRAWKPLPPEMQTLRFLLARREDVQHMLQQERNRLHAGRMDDWIRTRVQQHVTQLDKEMVAVWKFELSISLASMTQFMLCSDTYYDCSDVIRSTRFVCTCNEMLYTFFWIIVFDDGVQILVLYHTR